MVEFTKRVTKLSSTRLIVEIPKNLIISNKIKHNDTVDVKKKEDNNG